MNQDVSTPSSQIPKLSSSRKITGQLDSSTRIQKYEYNKDDYLLVCDGRVLSVSKEECDLMTIERWEMECKHYEKISRIPFFARFKKWKPFHVWRTNVRSKKINMARYYLQNGLFIVSQVCFYVLSYGISLS